MRPRSSEAEPRARRAQGERLLDWGPWVLGIDITLKYISDTFKGGKVLHKPKVIMYSKLDVNVPHGKAATETLMLRTVVSLASDDPGPELLETRRGIEEEERELRCYGPSYGE